MLATSPAFDFMANHCTRFIASDVAIVYNKEDIINPVVHAFCDEPDFCNPQSFWVCNDLGLLPFYDYDNYSNCDLLSFELNQECNRPVGDIQKKYGDIVLNNTSHKYGLVNAPYDCDGPVYLDNRQLQPGLPVRIRVGFKPKCDGTPELVNEFTGSITDWPSYTKQEGGDSTVSIHIEDNMSLLLSQTAPVGTYSGTAASIIMTLLADVGISINIPDASGTTLTITTEQDKTLADYLYDLVAIDGGRMYMDQLGNFNYHTASYSKSQNPTPVYIIDTCKHVIDIGSQRRGNIYNRVKVQQFTNAGGIECSIEDSASIKQYGVFEYIYTNPLVDTVEKACDIANRILTTYSTGDLEREISVIGIPQLESGDVVDLEERVANLGTPGGTCGCGSSAVKQRVRYKICSIHHSFGEGGYTQKITLHRENMPLVPITLCEDALCDINVGFIC